MRSRASVLQSLPTRRGLSSQTRRLVAMATLSLLALLSLGQATPDASSAIPGDRQARNVAVITVRGEIDDVLARSIRRRMTMAERAGADAIVFDIDTPGGEVGAVLAICNLIKKSPIPNTVAWINPDAYSGGALIALACREMVCADPASMGDAIPIGFDAVRGRVPISPEDREKILSVLISELTDSARRRGYDEKLMQGLVALGVELWLVEHTETKRRLFIGRAEHELLFGAPPQGENPQIPSSGSGGDPPTPESPAPAPAVEAEAGPQPEDPMRFSPASPALEAITATVTSNQELPSGRPVLSEADRGEWTKIEKVTDGRGAIVFRTDQLLRYRLAVQVVRNDEELKGFFGARHLLRLDASWSESLVSVMTLLPVRALLIVVFLLGLFLEMTNPGVALPGVVAAAALIGLIAPPMLINLANWWELAAIVGGILLIILEILVIPGFGVFGVVGIVLLFGGLVGTFVPAGGYFPDSPARRNDLLGGVATLVLAVATSGVLMYFISRHFGSIPVFNRLILRDTPVGEDRDAMLAAMAVETVGPIARGARGVALTPLRPSGRAQFGDRVVDVVAEMGFVPEGAPVVITEAGGFRIAVEAVREGPGAAGGPPA